MPQLCVADRAPSAGAFCTQTHASRHSAFPPAAAGRPPARARACLPGAQVGEALPFLIPAAVAAAAVLSESKAFAAAAQLGSVWQRAERLSQVRARGSASRACASPPPELGGL